MKIFHKIALLVLLILFPNFVFAGMEFNSNIEKVIVFRDGALVKRFAKLKVKKGENVFQFSGFSGDLNENSVQIGFSEDFVKILDVKVEKTFVAKASLEKVKSLKEKIENLESNIKQLTGEISAINNYVEFLKKLSPFSMNQKLLQSEFEGYAKFIEDSMKKGYKDIANYEISINKLKEEKQALEKELSNISKVKEDTKNIIIILNSKKDAEINLEIDYLVETAKWVPKYDLYVDTKSGKMTLDIYAEVTQSTGEDWKDVSIEISTTRPKTGVMPELKPWYLDIFKERLPVVYKGGAKGEELLIMRKSLEEEESLPQLKDEGISFSFSLKENVSIPSDNQPHRILLNTATIDTTQEKEGKLIYQSIPKLSPYVYLIGIFKNPFGFPIIPGKMNIYLDGKYANAVDLKKDYVSDEEMQLSLGIDESIKIERKRVKKFVEYPGIISKNVKIIYEYDIDVINGKKKEVMLKVLDQYPVSLNEQIKVNLEIPQKVEAEIKDDGTITWQINLKQGEKRKLKIKFTVEHPKELKISGLE